MALNFANTDALFLRAREAFFANRAAEAEGLLRQVLAFAASHVDALYLLGALTHRTGRNDEARSLATRALAIAPNAAPAYALLGEIERVTGRGEQALDAYRRAVALDRTRTDAWNGMGITLAFMGRLTEAIEVLQSALAIDPGFVLALNNLGNIYFEHGDPAAAIEYHRRALAAQPKFDSAHSNMLRELALVPNVAPATMRAEHARWWQQHAANITPLPLANSPGPDRPLRVGYVSGDFRDHSVAFFFEPLLAGHDRSRILPFCYAQVPGPDAVTQRLMALAAGWRNTVGVSDEQVAAMVQRDQIDILVDLAGHTSGNRLRVFAYKPAPVQISVLGYPFTTGSSVFDWKLTDIWADPPGMTESHYAERLLRLPRTAWCYRPPVDAPDPITPVARPLRFGTFNSFTKVNPVAVELWARLLQQHPGSQFVFKTSGPSGPTQHDRLRAMFAVHGITPDRLVLLFRAASTREHLACYREIDVALDTYPYHGTTTTCEALWMGVPVVALAGTMHYSRVGVSLLQNMGLSDLIANTPDEYVAIASALAADTSRRAELRRTLRQRMRQSPLMDEAAYVRDVEAAYRQAWQAWCAARRS